MDDITAKLNLASVIKPQSGAGLISVIIPCFNRARFLPDAVRSLQAQTYPNWECTIVNDGSTDNSASVAENLARAEPRVRVVNQPNRGPAAARNRGLAEARGRFIQFLDSDDVLKPQKFELQLSSFADSQKLVVAICDYYFARSDDLQIEESSYYTSPAFRTSNHLAELISRWETHLSIPCHCFLFDARFFSLHRVRFDESLRNHEDWECWVRIFSFQPFVSYQNIKLAVYRFHPNSISRDRRAMRQGFLNASDKLRRRFRKNDLLAKAISAKSQEIRANYRDQELTQIWRRTFTGWVLNIRGLISRIARVILPKNWIAGLERLRR
jgi:glycosyltransferase involved in cell wall biosynthesis